MKKGNTLGAIVRTQRLLGIELELIDGESELDESNLPDHVDATSDGSLNDGGIELVTDPLQGKQFEETVSRLCVTAQEAGLKPDSSCGYHVHISAADYIRPANIKKLRTLMLFYLTFDDVIRSLVSPSRRNNRFCREMVRAYRYRNVCRVKTIAEAEGLWYKLDLPYEIERAKAHKYNDTRYFSVNFHSLFKDGHIEIRYHQGTADAAKVLHWAALHAQVLDRIKQGKIVSRDVHRTVVRTLTMKEKTDVFFSYLGLPQASETYLRRRQQKLNADTIMAHNLDTLENPDRVIRSPLEEYKARQRRREMRAREYVYGQVSTINPF